jgi:hypothetical protein
MHKFLYVICLTLTSVPNLARAACETAVIEGTVTDQTGESLPGATVKVIDGAQLVRGTIADPEGRFRLSLKAGVYTVEVSYVGASTFQTRIDLPPGKEKKLDVVLSQSIELKEVVVTASLPTPIICRCPIICTWLHDEKPQKAEQKPAEAWQAVFYPNPASNQVQLELSHGLQSLTLLNADGRLLRNLENLPAGQHTLLVNDLAPGPYILRFWKDGQVRSEKLLIARP